MYSTRTATVTVTYTDTLTEGGRGRVVVYSIRQKKLPCTVCFTPDRLSKMALKRAWNGY